MASGFFNSVSKVFRSNPDGDGRAFYTPLQNAILDNDLKKLRSLIARGANLNLSGRSGYPPLHLALRKNRYTMVLALMEAGADVNLKDDLGWTPLHHAVNLGQDAFIMAFIKLKADPNVKDETGRTPLHLVKPEDPEIIDILAASNANLNAQASDGNTPLHLFLKEPVLAARILLYGADPNVHNAIGISPYEVMLEGGRLKSNTEIVYKMLTLQADITKTNSEGKTVLHLAAEQNLGKIFHLAAPAADLSSQDEEGNTVLHALMLRRNSSLLEKALEQAPALVDALNHHGHTPLALLLAYVDEGDCAFDDACVAAIRLLLKHKASPDTRDEKGAGLLHHAVTGGKMDFLEELLVQGMPPDMTDRAGKTALHYAIENRNLAAMDVLLDRGANPDMTDARGWTILDRLAESGDRDSSMVQRLIVAGGQYQKQLPLYPDMIRSKPVIKSRPKPPVV